MCMHETCSNCLKIIPHEIPLPITLSPYIMGLKELYDKMMKDIEETRRVMRFFPRDIW